MPLPGARTPLTGWETSPIMPTESTCWAGGSDASIRRRTAAVITAAASWPEDWVMSFSATAFRPKIMAWRAAGRCSGFSPARA